MTIALELRDVRCAWSASWWESETESYDGVELILRPGEWCAILGDNGLGKSTLLHGIAGTCPCVRGPIKVLDKQLHDRDLQQRVDLGVYLVPQEPKCPANWTFADIEAMAMKCRPGLKLRKALVSLRRMLKEKGILDAAEVRLFSPKEARALIAVMSCPSVLLLDEAGEHLTYLPGDHKSDVWTPLPPEAFYALVREVLPQAAVLIVEHNQRLAARFADQVIYTSLEESGGRDIYRFESMDVKKFAAEVADRTFVVQDNAVSLPLLELDRSVEEHMQLALQSSRLHNRKKEAIFNRATADWNYLSSFRRSDELSGGQKIVLHCVMELLAFGKVDLRAERMKHVSNGNVRRLEQLAGLPG